MRRTPIFITILCVLFCSTEAIAQDKGDDKEPQFPSKSTSHMDRWKQVRDQRAVALEQSYTTPHWLLALSLDFHLGGINASDVNKYMNCRFGSKSYISGFPELYVALGLGMSLHVRPHPHVVLRPNLQVNLAPKEIEGGSTEENFLLWSVAPGLALDFIVNPRDKVQFFFMVESAYVRAGFEGIQGNGAEAGGGIGINILFKGDRKNGFRIMLSGRWAKAWTGTGPTATSGQCTPFQGDLHLSGGMLTFGPIFNFVAQDR